MNLYLTGTDTGVGKTLAAASLLHALRGRGLRAVGMKPVASGCEATAAGWRNADALALQAASAPQPDYALVNPYPLPAATAPAIAAARAGVAIGLAPIRQAYAALAAQADRVVVEGVGGWAAPLAEGLDQVDLVRELDLAVVLVVGLRLGCINHARLSVRALHADDVRLLGWVLSEPEPDLPWADDYRRSLAQALVPLPRLAHLPHAGHPDPRGWAGCWTDLDWLPGGAG